MEHRSIPSWALMLVLVAACSGGGGEADGGEAGGGGGCDGACIIQWNNGAGYALDVCSDGYCEESCAGWAAGLGDATWAFHPDASCASYGYTATCGSGLLYKTCPGSGGCSEDGAVCSVPADCCGATSGTSTCVEFNGGQVLCAHLCASGADCASGCCVPLVGGGGACAAASQCAASCAAPSSADVCLGSNVHCGDFVGRAVCCPSSNPYYCSISGYCYTTAEGASAACGGGTCVACRNENDTGSCDACLDTCRGLPGCCTGCGCLCQTECGGWC